MKARIPGAQKGGQSQQAMLRQVQKMQEDMAALQEDIEQREFTANSGNGMVEATVTGKHELKQIKINPDMVDPDDVEMLEDFIILAVNAAIKEATETQENEMGALTGGLNIPGLF